MTDLASTPWLSTLTTDAPDGVVVETKIDDHNGERNVQALKRSGSLWFVPDDSMYVYYRPTHWRALASVATPDETGGGRG